MEKNQLEKLEAEVKIKTKFFDWYKEKKMDRYDNIFFIILFVIFMISIITLAVFLENLGYKELNIVIPIIIITIIFFLIIIIYCFYIGNYIKSHINIKSKDVNKHLKRWREYYSINKDEVEEYSENINLIKS